MTRMAIEARDLQLAYRRKPILNHLSLAVPEGAVLGLVGRNGAGKSTLMRCLIGLVKPSQGDCRIGGHPSQDLADEVRERLGVVAQTPDLFEWLTGEQHFEQIGTMYRDWQHDRAWALATQLDLSLLTPARALSLGDQQKLAVVLALGHDPDWLLLDEPVASLDPVARRAFMRALFDRVEREDPRTVIISSHLLSDLERVVSHVAFMQQGRIQRHGRLGCAGRAGALRAGAGGTAARLCVGTNSRWPLDRGPSPGTARPAGGSHEPGRPV